MLADEKEPDAKETSDCLFDNAASNKPREYKDLEAVFCRIGGTGRYNLLVLAAMMFCNVFPGMITLSANFTAADMPFNCTEYANHSSSGASGQMVSLSGCSVSPGSGESREGPVSQCHITYNCSLASDPLEAASSSMHSAACRKFQFGRELFQETAVSRFSLVCHRAWMANLATTFYFVGFLIGCSLYGALADRFGRLRVVTVSLLHMSVCTVGASQAPHLWLYWSLQLLTGVGIGGFLSCTFSFALENTDSEHRSVWGFNLHNGWTCGIFLGTLLAYFERHYQRLLLIYGLSVAAALPMLLLLSESPRWLVSAGQYHRADAVLRRIARLNGRPLLRAFSTEATAPVAAEGAAAAASALDLLRRPGLRRVTLIVWAMFFSVSMAYYGISLGIGDLGGSIFLNQMISAAVEIPARLLGMAASYRIGRRLSIGIAFGSAGLCLFATAFLFGHSGLTGARIATAMTGKFWITLAFDLAWLYSAEVFPTSVRSLGVGIGSTFARAGAMVSTLVPGLGLLWQPLPFLVLALGPMLVVLLALVAPETKGQQLPETLDDGERLATGGARILGPRRAKDTGDAYNETEL